MTAIDSSVAVAALTSWHEAHETSRRAAAETVLVSGADMPGLVTRFFEKRPPLTPAGRIRYAEALAAAGRQADAAEQARRAWRSGVLRANDESRVTAQFRGGLSPADHDARMDMLLWQGATSAAQRQLDHGQQPESQEQRRGRRGEDEPSAALHGQWTSLAYRSEKARSTSAIF